MGALQDKMDELMTELGVPGAAAGVVVNGEQEHAYAGVTSIENPLPVDAGTLFQFGSTGKTFTATALMVLQERGLVDLQATVRTYVPELVLQDEDVAAKVTVLQLLNHTAGWEGDALEVGCEGEDGVEVFVRKMADLVQVTPLGAGVSYNNASLVLAGRVIEKVTGKRFAVAIKELLLDPLGMTMSFYDTNDIVVRRFAVGHAHGDDGSVSIAHPWRLPRGGDPAGGMSANVDDLLTWARFHLGEGGADVLSLEARRRMQEPTVSMAGSALGDWVGTSWLLADVDGQRTVGHGGSMIGQFSDFTMVPAQGFAFTSMANSGPFGSQLNHALQTWALEHYCGIVSKEAELVDLGDLSAYVGSFETIAAVVDISVRETLLVLHVTEKPNGVEEPSEPRDFVVGLTAPDRYVIAEGPAKGMKGYFSRDDQGAVDGVHLGGRLAVRVTV